LGWVGLAGEQPSRPDDGLWSIYFNTVLIATLNERDYIIRA